MKAAAAGQPNVAPTPKADVAGAGPVAEVKKAEKVEEAKKKVKKPLDSMGPDAPATVPPFSQTAEAAAALASKVGPNADPADPAAIAKATSLLPASKYRSNPSAPIVAPTPGPNGTTGTGVVFAQGDGRWGGNRLGNGTIAQQGCAITSLAMAMSDSTGKIITPDQVARMPGAVDPSNGRVNFAAVGFTRTGFNADVLKQKLAAGQEVVMKVGGSTAQHWIAVKSFDEKTGLFTAKDPAGGGIIHLKQNGGNLESVDGRRWYTTRVSNPGMAYLSDGSAASQISGQDVMDASSRTTTGPMGSGGVNAGANNRESGQAVQKGLSGDMMARLLANLDRDAQFLLWLAQQANGKPLTADQVQALKNQYIQDKFSTMDGTSEMIELVNAGAASSSTR